jgi:hypothetical protein
MTPGNFDWFLHSMLYYHTKHVIRRQEIKRQGKIKKTASDDEDDNSTEDEV